MNQNKGKEKHQPVHVFLRIRPMNKQELHIHNFNVVDVKSAKEVTVRPNTCEKYHRNFTYDRVFGPSSTQMDIYKHVAQPMVTEVLAGYNCTVFAYGQTGTGKTYTMTGNKSEYTSKQDTWQEDVHSGIIPRTLAHLFDELRVRKMDSNVLVSYMELYNEELFDLLSPPDDTSKLKLYDDNTKKGSVVIQGLTEISVSTKSQVFKILEQGAEKRKTASTLMNAMSSRSHCVFCITVHIKETTDDGEDLLKTGKLYLVDLAGSENIKQSGATDKRAREACNINQSLLTLGRVITCLAERRSHVPYRESKLTRLLQDSLGGRTKTSLIATVSPANGNLDETINTLEYALRARNITNKPEVNQSLTRKAIIKEYAEQIERLKKDLLATRLGSGVCMAQENYDDMMKQLEIQKDEITEKINTIRMLKEQMDRDAEICKQLKMDLETARREIDVKEGEIDQLESVIGDAKREICDLQGQRQRQEIVLAKQTNTAKILKNTAQKLLQVATVSTSDNEKLHDKIDVLSELSRQNKQTHSKHLSRCSEQMRVAHDDLEASMKHRFEFYDRLEGNTYKVQASHEQFAERRTALRADLAELRESLSRLEVANKCGQQNLFDIISNAKVTVDDGLQMARTRFEEHFRSRCQPLFDNFIAKLDDLLECVISSAEETVREAEQQSGQVMEMVEQQRNTLEDLEGASEVLASEIDRLAGTYLRTLKQLLYLEENRKVFDEQMQIAFSVLRRVSEISAESHDRTKIDMQYILKNLQLGDDGIRQVRSELGRVKSNVDEELSELEEKQKRVSDEIREKVNTRKEKTRSMVADTFSRVKRIYEAHGSAEETARLGFYSQRDAFVSRLDDHLVPAIEENLRLSSTLLNDGARKLEAIADTERSSSSELAASVAAHVASVESLIEGDRIAVCDDHEGFHAKLSELQETVANIDYREYQKTHQTPARNTYSYPRELPDVREPEDITDSPIRVGKIIDMTYNTPERSPLRPQNAD